LAYPRTFVRFGISKDHAPLYVLAYPRTFVRFGISKDHAPLYVLAYPSFQNRQYGRREPIILERKIGGRGEEVGKRVNCTHTRIYAYIKYTHTGVLRGEDVGKRVETKIVF
jgi:hypothetical protein